MINSRLREILVQLDNCKICKGTRYVREGEKTKPCACVIRAKMDYAIYQANIPAKYKNFSFDSYVLKQSPTYGNLMKYLDKIPEAMGKGIGLFLWGEKYSGKTFLAICVLKALIKMNYSCYFIRFNEILPWYQSDLVRKEKLFEVDFLCIDQVTTPLDLARNVFEGSVTETPTHYVSNVLEEIISTRAFRSKPTIVTSSISIAEIEKKFSVLAASLIENCLEIRCEGGEVMQDKIINNLKSEFGFDELK